RLKEDGISRYRAYVLYGVSVENILRRVVAFVGGCENIIADTMLKEFLRKLCLKDSVFVELKDYLDVDKVIASSEEGKAIVFSIEAPRDDVFAVALVPVDKFNKSVVRVM
ncbi:MAG: hypothetical protein QXF79_04555, partial [Ignisphaera sp.]